MVGGIVIIILVLIIAIILLLQRNNVPSSQQTEDTLGRKREFDEIDDNDEFALSDSVLQEKKQEESDADAETNSIDEQEITIEDKADDSYQDSSAQSNNLEKLFYSRLKNNVKCPLSIRPIPGKDYQDILMAGYLLRIPSDMDYEVDTCGGDLMQYYDWVGEIPSTSSLYMRIGLSEDEPNMDYEEKDRAVIKIYVDDLSNDNEIENYIEKHKINESKLDENEKIIKDEECVINNMQYTHTLADVSDLSSIDYPCTRCDSYMALMNTELIEIELSCNVKKYDKYKSKITEILNTVSYLGGGSFEEGALFVRDETSFDELSYGRNDIDDGMYVYRELIGMDYDTLLNEIEKYKKEMEALPDCNGLNDIEEEKYYEENSDLIKEVENCAETFSLMLSKYEKYMGYHPANGEVDDEYVTLYRSALDFLMLFGNKFEEPYERYYHKWQEVQ